MHWVVALLGAILGAILGDGNTTLLGIAVGALIGWQAVRIAQLRGRLYALECKSRAPELATAADEAVHKPQWGMPPPTPPTPESESAVITAVPVEEPTAPPPATAAAATDAQPETVSEYGEGYPEPVLDRAFRRLGMTLKRGLFEGNVPVKMGMLVLFVGMAAALKYALDEGYFHLPLSVRFALVAAAGVAGLVWGWRSRIVRPVFGLSLQGGAIGVLLLVVFAAFRPYQLLEAGAAFALVLILVAGAAVLAILQNAVALAVLGFTGGYLAPVLISTGSGDPIALFSYYAVLNAAVFGVAWLRSWRALNLLGFGFTFVVGTLWGSRYYQPALRATVEPFLILFFLFYVGIAVLYAIRRQNERRPVVDGALVFGTPLLAFGLQAGLLADDRIALAYSALAVAALYALLAVWLLRGHGLALLGRSFAVLSVGFATLAVPLALSARWTSSTWAIEGAALVWLGLRQNQRLPRFTGLLLQLLAVVAYLISLANGGWEPVEPEWLVLNGHALGLLLMAGAAFFTSFQYETYRLSRPVVWVPFIAGVVAWTWAGIREIDVNLDAVPKWVGVVWLLAITLFVAALLRQTIPWARLGWPVVLAAVVAAVLALGCEHTNLCLLHLPGAPAWLAVFTAMAFALRGLRQPLQRGVSVAHVAALWMVAIAVGLSAYHVVRYEQDAGNGWEYVVLVLPLFALLFATARWPRWAAWPLADLFPRYALLWFGPAGTVAALAWLGALQLPGDSAPLPFVPLLNPIELLQLIAWLASLRQVRGNSTASSPSSTLQANRSFLNTLLALAGFAFVTAASLRAVHHLADVPWSAELWASRLAQTTLTITWSVIGVAAWIAGSRRRQWPVWLCGAILMGIVLAKLILVDRHYMGNLVGIVSFITVGALLVLVGRIAPTPPRRAVTELP